MQARLCLWAARASRVSRLKQVSEGLDAGGRAELKSITRISIPEFHPPVHIRDRRPRALRAEHVVEQGWQEARQPSGRG